MKKALDQTLRDLKREVNKKVLKVPGIEQKVLDATSNEPWGPHGSHLADIAQATRNYHEYQMIMSVVWKRINDTGKNWRHVYKALTVLEYLVANGSERVIDEIREHAYQISTLSDFQYIDSNGRDQGSNVRKKSQSLVVLVNDKERIQEVRQKALTNKEKFRNASTGGMYRPGAYPSTGDRYDDDRSEGRYRDEDRNGYGRERDYRDDDRYSRDGNRYGRESEDQYRDGDYRGRSQNIDDYQYGSRSRSSDGYRERNFDDDRYSSRSSGARAEDQSQDERRLERKFSEQNIGGPPTYEEAVGDVRSPVHNERGRDGEIEEAVTPKASSPTGSMNQGPVSDEVTASGFTANKEVDGFDEFDPRSSASAPPPTTSGEMDLLGSLSDSFSSNALALMPATSSSDADAPFNSGSGPTFVALSSASTVLSQPIEDPFGDSPFKATPVQEEIPVQAQSNPVTSSFQSMTNSEPLNPSGPRMETGFDFGDTFPGVTYAPSNTQVPSNNLQLLPPEQSFGNQDTDVLANILPPPGPAGPVASQTLFSASSGSQAGNASHGNFGMQASNGGPGNFGVQSGYATQIASQASSTGHGNFGVQSGYTTQASPQASSTGSGNFGMPSGYTTQATPQASSTASGNFGVQSGYTTQVAPQGGAHQAPLTPHQNNDIMGNFLPHTGNTMQMVTQGAITAPTGASSNAQVHKKFEPKSTVWADTLSRGLVNLNISGPKTNPLADIGVDFDSINRKEKREKPATATPVTSAITMGKAMGSGSGIGRAGANVLARPNTTMNSGMGMGMGMGSGMGMGMGTGGGGGMMGNYGGGMNQNSGMGMRPGMGMGMGMGMGPGTGMGMGAGMGSGTGMGVGMGMNMGGIGQGRPPVGGLPPGAQMPGNYNPNYNNPMMGGQGNYPQPYGGYR